MKKILLVLLAVVVLIGGTLMGSYNGLVSANEQVTGQWSQVENQLQRRNDLIPNLVNTVKGYAAHETQVYADVANARAKLAGARNVSDAAAASGELDGALSRLLAIAENYPDLKSNTNFLQLQDELAGTENRIAVARRDYNQSVQTFNAKIKSFPTNILLVCLVLRTGIISRLMKGQDGSAGEVLRSSREGDIPMKKKLLWLLLVLQVIFFLPWGLGQAAGIPPKPARDIYVVDEAGVLSSRTKQIILAYSSALAKRTKTQVVVLTVPTLDGESIEDYGLSVLREWGIGDKKKKIMAFSFL